VLCYRHEQIDRVGHFSDDFKLRAPVDPRSDKVTKHARLDRQNDAKCRHAWFLGFGHG
jgi:hypothetical protein